MLFDFQNKSQWDVTELDRCHRTRFVLSIPQIINYIYMMQNVSNVELKA